MMSLGPSPGTAVALSLLSALWPWPPLSLQTLSGCSGSSELRLVGLSGSPEQGLSFAHSQVSEAGPALTCLTRWAS